MSRGRLAWWCCFTCVCAVLIVPLFLVEIPPLTDYPNHLAREFILSAGRDDPIVSAMYAQRWRIIPNLAIDVVMPAMARIVPLYAAGRIMLGATAVLIVGGAAAYHRAVFRRRSFWPLASGLIAYNGLFLLGFLNFVLSLGLALTGSAAWLAWRDRRPVLTVFAGALISTAIFFTHVFGLVLLFAIVGGFELERLLAVWRRGKGALAQAGWTALRLTGFLPPVILSFLSPVAHAGGRVIWRPLPQKLFLLISPFLTYDGLTGIGIGAVFLGSLYVLFRTGRLAMAPGARWTLALLTAAYLACPFIVDGTGFVADRFPVMMMLVLFAATTPICLGLPGRGVMVVLLTAAFTVRMAGIAMVWYGHNADLTEMRAVIAPVPPGAKVLIVTVDPADNPAYWQSVPLGRRIPYFFRTDIHLPAILLTEHRAFWPLLFAAPGKQPIVLRPPFDRLDGELTAPLDYRLLEPQADESSRGQYWENWQTDFDYVLMLNAGGLGDLDRYDPGRLTLLRRGDVAALFKVLPRPMPCREPGTVVAKNLPGKDCR